MAVADYGWSDHNGGASSGVVLLDVNRMMCTRSAFAGVRWILRYWALWSRASMSDCRCVTTVGISGTARRRERSSTKVAQAVRAGQGAGGVMAED